MSISWELLAKGQRCSILCVSSANFYNFVELPHFLFKGVMDEFQVGKEDTISFQDSGNVHGSGIAIITRLRSVNMVIRMNGFVSEGSSHDLDGSVGDNLIGIHIWLSSGASLPDNQWEVIIKFSLDDFISCLDDCLSYIKGIKYIYF